MPTSKHVFFLLLNSNLQILYKSNLLSQLQSHPAKFYLKKMSLTLQMESLKCSLIALLLLSTLQLSLVKANFYQDTFFNWGYQNTAIWGSGDDLALLLDRASGSGIQTKNQFLFGSIEMQIKLVSGNSAGTVTAYYMSSTGNHHDEIDFEFLGNVSGQPYTIHTNVFVNGTGNREQQFYPWFDPTADFHNYTIHWNPSQIVWFVDGIPIRVYRNYEKMGIPYPNSQAMKIYSSLWNADNWATRGGLVKIDWNSAPFVARYRGLKLRACYWYGPGSSQYCSRNAPNNWWTSPEYNKLGYAQIGQLKWVRNNYMIYDYCKDVYRFHGKLPLECYQPLF